MIGNKLINPGTTRPAFQYKNKCWRFETMRCLFFACLIALELFALVYLLGVGHFAADRMEPVLRCNRQLVQVLDLTDLSIWTGARYTRHLSQADMFSAFQDSMGALEHFPAGALTPLPVPMRQPASISHREHEDEPTS